MLESYISNNDTVISPNHQWNNFIHSFWFITCIIGFIYIIMLFFIYEKSILPFIATFLLFEIFIGLIVCVHYLELIILKDNIKQD